MCGTDWQALQNLCDMHNVELRENKYQLGLGDEGYTVTLRLGQTSHSAHVPYMYTLNECVEWITDFIGRYRGD